VRTTRPSLLGYSHRCRHRRATAATVADFGFATNEECFVGKKKRLCVRSVSTTHTEIRNVNILALSAWNCRAVAERSCAVNFFSPRRPRSSPNSDSEPRSLPSGPSPSFVYRRREGIVQLARATSNCVTVPAAQWHTACTPARGGVTEAPSCSTVYMPLQCRV